MKSPLLLPALIACVLGASACSPTPDPQAQQAAQAAQAQATAEKAEAMARDFDSAYGQGNYTLARAQGDVLLATYPESEAAGRIKERHAEVKSKADAAQQSRRMAALWAYQTQPVGTGEQISAGVYSRDVVKTGSKAGERVRLIFRDHPEWGRSSYLVLQDGDFDCYGGCRVQVAIDDKPTERMAASRPKTDEAIAMFIEDEFALWRKAQQADRTMTITFPVKAGGTREVMFEVGGLDASKLPKWPQAS